ncbi:MAG: shikimate dehydrogenase [Bacteroidia bacterium]|nr:shikimate dehydrogenase [Bacteroidia bacterium]
MIEFGLIGKSLKHSFSKTYFEKKFKELGLVNYAYLNFELPSIIDFEKLISEHSSLKGLNVTIPYKELIIPFLDDLSSEAKEIGAVNCIHIRDGKKTGYNTDAYGFSQSIKPFLDTNHERALILGTGGASKAIAYALKKVGVEVYFVTSSAIKEKANSFFYNEINELVMNAFKLIVNTTPLGTTPNEKEYPNLPYQLFTSDHLAYDLVYNPPETEFLKKAKEFGAVTMNGLSMLHLQAEKSWEIWQG